VRLLHHAQTGSPCRWVVHRHSHLLFFYWGGEEGGSCYIEIFPNIDAYLEAQTCSMAYSIPVNGLLCHQPSRVLVSICTLVVASMPEMTVGPGFSADESFYSGLVFSSAGVC